MGENSKIAWTDHTFNPWWGCRPVSTGCANCYAAAFAKRTGKDCFGSGQRRLFAEKHWSEPLKWAQAARESGGRAKVFCASMADVFEDAPGLDAQRDRLSDLIHETADALDWLLLTKRPMNFGMMPAETLALCWLGVTVEDQPAADERIPLLLQARAAMRFLSCEPLLGDLNLHRALCRYAKANRPEQRFCSLCEPWLDGRGIGWVIVGGESGVKARPFHLEWARSIVGQCKSAGAACFVKQMGRKPLVPMDGPMPPAGFPFTDRDGRDPVEWPEDLRLQEFPEVTHA